MTEPIFVGNDFYEQDCIAYYYFLYIFFIFLLLISKQTCEGLIAAMVYYK